MDSQISIAIIIIIIIIIIVCMICYNTNNSTTTCNNRQNADSFQLSPLQVCQDWTPITPQFETYNTWWGTCECIYGATVNNENCYEFNCSTNEQHTVSGGCEPVCTPGYSVPGSNAVYCQSGTTQGEWSSCKTYEPAICLPGCNWSWDACAYTIPSTCIAGFTSVDWSSCAYFSPSVCQPGTVTEWSSCAIPSTPGGECVYGPVTDSCQSTIDTCQPGTTVIGCDMYTPFGGGYCEIPIYSWAKCATGSPTECVAGTYWSGCAYETSPTPCYGGTVTVNSNCATMSPETCIPGVVAGLWSNCAIKTPAECIPQDNCIWSSCLYTIPETCIPGSTPGTWTGCLSTTEEVISAPYYVPESCT